MKGSGKLVQEAIVTMASPTLKKIKIYIDELTDSVSKKPMSISGATSLRACNI